MKEIISKIKEFIVDWLYTNCPCLEVGMKIVESAEAVNEIEAACSFSLDIADKMHLFLGFIFKAIFALVILKLAEGLFAPFSCELINSLKIPVLVQPICRFISGSILAKMLWSFI